MESRPILDDEVFELLEDASDSNEIMDLLGILSINDLVEEQIFKLLKYANDKEKMAIILGSKNIDRLSIKSILLLIASSINDSQTLSFLGEEIIEKLSDSHLCSLFDRAIETKWGEELIVSYVFQYRKNLPENCVWLLLSKASDLNIMAERIGRSNIAKLTEESVVSLLNRIDDSDKIASILGTDNMNKLSYNSVYQLLYAVSDKKKKKRTNAILSHTEFPETAFVFYQLFKSSNNRKLKKTLFSKYKKLPVWEAWHIGWHVWGPLLALFVLLLLPLWGIEEFTWRTYFINLAIWGGVLVIVCVIALLRKIVINLSEFFSQPRDWGTEIRKLKWKKRN